MFTTQQKEICVKEPNKIREFERNKNLLGFLKILIDIEMDQKKINSLKDQKDKPNNDLYD